MTKDEQMYPQPTRDLVEQRNRLAPGPAEAFQAFSKRVFADGALPAKTKQLIAVAVAHVTQVAVAGIFAPGLANVREKLSKFGPVGAQQGPHDRQDFGLADGQLRPNSCHSARSRASCQLQQYSLRLIIQSVRGRDF